MHRYAIASLLALVLAGVFTHAALAVSQEAWANTSTHAHPPQGAVFKEYLHAGESVDITIVLRLRNRDQLTRRMSSLTTPGNPEFRRWLTKDVILRDYAPYPNQAKAVADYLSAAGFTNVKISADQLVITATGTAGVIRKAFDTELARFVLNGREAIANIQDVHVPGSLSGIVLSVLGLQTLDRMRPLSVRASRVLVSGTVHGLNPVSFPVAYDAAALPPASTVAVGIITEGNMTQTIADLHQFESQNGLPTINPVVVQVGAAGTDTSGTAEWDLDSQSIQGMSGGQVGTMTFYVAHSLADSDITQAIHRAVSDNTVSVINISLGQCERAAFADGSMAADDQIFQLAIAQGQTVSVASGDSGSKECSNRFGPIAGASYPASSPYVIAVGGTTLSTDADGNYAGETVWSGSGGSPSLYEAKPSWQGGVVAGSYRGVPDIAFDADPNSGAVIVVNGQNQQWGGTSLASPLFVGAWARIQTANDARLGFPASWIYSHGSQGTAAYRDVISGSNGDYSAAAGWDYTTGFGSFDVAAATLLTQSSVAVSASPASITAGESVTLTATVTGNAPTGTVQFQVNGVNFDSPVTLINGVATLTTTQLPVGANAITAVYSGDLNNAGSGTATPLNVTVTNPVASTLVPALPVWGELLLGVALLLVAFRTHAKSAAG
jgi:pseudomonalisin/xanthomonalisin